MKRAAALLPPALLLGTVMAGDLRAGEIFGSAGWRKTYDDEGSIGSGAAGRFGAGWRWSDKSGVEVEFGLSRNRREITSGFVFSGRAADLSLSVIRHFGGGGGRPGSRVEPYVLGGAGLVHYTNLSVLPGAAAISRGALGYQLHGAFGVKGWLSERFYLRPEIRLSAAMGGALHDAVEPILGGAIVSFGAGYRW